MPIKNLYPTLLSLFCFLIVSTSQAQNKSSLKKSVIDINLIDYAEIKPYPKTSSSVKAKRIGKSVVMELIRDWNNSKTSVKCQDSYLYTVSIYFQDYTRRNFNVSNDIISEDNTYCVSIPDPGLAKRLWKGK